MIKLTNTSKILLHLILAILLTVSMASMAKAGTLQYNLDYLITGTDPGGSTPWITATFTDVSPNNVQLTMTASNLTGTQFISGMYFNLASSLNPALLSFAYGSNPVGTTPITQTANCCKADGDGYFDFLFNFPTSNNPMAGRFQPGESVVYNISYTGSGSIDVNSFNFISAPDGAGTGLYFVAAHIQGINGSDTTSGWVGATTVVPEPISSTLFIIGGALLGYRSYRKMKKA